MRNQGMIFLNSGGKIQWMTKLCHRWLGYYFLDGKPANKHLPRPLQQWLACQRSLPKNKNRSIDAPLVIKRKDKQLVVRLAEENNDELILSLTEQPAGADIASPRAPQLTVREREVLHWIAQGKRNPEIAIILNLSTRTVEKHAENIFRKLGVENRNAAALSAIGLFQSDGK